LSNAIRGGIYYIAPESYHSRIYSPKSDVYSLGIIFWELFENKSITSIYKPSMKPPLITGSRPDFKNITDGKLKDLITSMWKENPSVRPEVTNILIALENVAIDSKPATKPEQVIVKLDKQEPKPTEIVAKQIETRSESNTEQKQIQDLHNSSHFLKSKSFNQPLIIDLNQTIINTKIQDDKSQQLQKEPEHVFKQPLTKPPTNPPVPPALKVIKSEIINQPDDHKDTLVNNLAHLRKGLHTSQDDEDENLEALKITGITNRGIPLYKPPIIVQQQKSTEVQTSVSVDVTDILNVVRDHELLTKVKAKENNNT